MAQFKTNEGYDNEHPRNQQKTLDGWGSRALAAHQNTFEAFPGFAIGVLFAMFFQADINLIFYCCLAFVAARIAYILLYLWGKGFIRSAVWGVAYFATLGLYILPLLKS